MREWAQTGEQRPEGRAGLPLSKEPGAVEAVLDSRTLGPEPKADP